MSSSYLVELPQSNSSKRDEDTLVLMVNDNGVISVDEDTLHSLIMNQTDATVSVVRLGQTMSNETGNDEVTLTVDPPSYVPPEPSTNAVPATDAQGNVLVDPFIEMDQEQLERLQTALQSEEAKQILGENVTAMLDMLSVEEEQNSIRHSIELDHCYTNRLTPAEIKSAEALQQAIPSVVSDTLNIDNMSLINPSSTLVSATNAENKPVATLKQHKTTTIKTTVKIVSGRSQGSSQSATPVNSKTNSGNSGLRTLPSNARQQAQTSLEREGAPENVDYDGLSSSTASSESEGMSDSDSDYGSRPQRRGVRSRGGRRGLTTRGGSLAAARRRTVSKQMDVEQMRRLDMEMAAAVNAMKTPDDLNKQKSTIKTKKPRTIKKNEETAVLPNPAPETLMNIEKPLQTTNQVKANLINANMIKGEMLITKPGQERKLIIVQKQALPKSPIKTVTIKKQLPIIKSKLNLTPNSKIQKQILPTALPPAANPTTSHQIITPTVTKVKIAEVKKDKPKKIEPSISEMPKSDADVAKVADKSSHDASKKSQKKDHRKADAHLVESLGPALFSTPDIIRRVGGNEPHKPAECSASTAGTVISNAPTPMDIEPYSTGTQNVLNSSVTAAPSVVSDSATVASHLSQTLQQPTLTQSNLDTKSISKPTDFTSIAGSKEVKGTAKTLENEGLHSKSEAAAHSFSSKVVSQSVEQASVSNTVLPESGIEGDENLLASLGMDTHKHEAELLAEALLLQEELGVEGVDLQQQVPLLGQTPSKHEALLPATPLLPVQQQPPKPTEPPPVVNSPKPASGSSVKKKDTKEPIQIIRGGRVITLPPIEAPSTRSKRLQPRTDNPSTPVTQAAHHRNEKASKSTPHHSRSSKAGEMVRMDDEADVDDDDEEENVSESEDDPHRLWCICKRPHNNRFMICCDVCEDWFHGNCVHVSKTMGQQMEDQGIEWVCPNCSKKKEKTKESKHTNSAIEEQHAARVKAEEQSISKHATPNVDTLHTPSKSVSEKSKVTKCVVCKKEARKSSIYCSDACILAHAQTTTKEKPSPSVAHSVKHETETPKRSDPRTPHADRKAGKSAKASPATPSITPWLKNNQSAEKIRANNRSTPQAGRRHSSASQTHGAKSSGTPQSNQNKMSFMQVPGSKQTVLAMRQTANSSVVNQPHLQPTTPQPQTKEKQVPTTPSSPTRSPAVAKQQGIKVHLKPVPKPTPVKKPEVKQPTKSPAVPKKVETEPIRVTVRKTLAELLTTRIKDAEDLNLSEAEIMELAVNIELEMYKFFKDAGSKYKAKYRSLVFNIRDVKNLTLYRKIADKSLTAEALVRLSPEEMASQELTEWREKETKHQLEMIKKNELDLMAQAKSIVVKTHKGEQIIENEGTIDHVDPETSVRDIVTALNSADTTEETIDNDEMMKGKSADIFRRSDSGEKKRNKGKSKDRDADGIGRSDRSRNKEKRSGSENRHHHSKDREHKRDRSNSKEKSKHSSKRGKDKRERDKDKSRKTKDRDRKDKDRKNKDRDKERHKSRSATRRSKSSHKSYKDKEIDRNSDDETKKEILSKDTTALSSKPIEDRLWRHVEDESMTPLVDGNDSDLSDREPSSTVTIKTPDINDDSLVDHALERSEEEKPTRGVMHTVWRGFVNMVDVAKFFITAQDVSGHARDLMDDLPDTVDVVGRISHETVWEYITKMKRSGSKEILVIRLMAANDEEKIPYITLYSYLNNRQRLGVVGTVSKNIKDFYIMPLSNTSQIPPVLLPLDGPGFEEDRPHLLLGIILRNKRKRPASIPMPISSKTMKKEPSDRNYTPPMMSTFLEDAGGSIGHTSDSWHEKASSKSNIETFSKIVPELSSKMGADGGEDDEINDLGDDGDEPYSPGELDVDEGNDSKLDASGLSSPKNSIELQRKMDELNRKIEEQKLQIQSMSSSFLVEASTTLPGLGLESIGSKSVEAYSPTDSRSFTPPPQNKYSQPIFAQVSDITIPHNLQEILANVKRQETSKVDSYLPSKPSATFLTTVHNSPSTSMAYDKPKPIYGSPVHGKHSHDEKHSHKSRPAKESKSTLGSLSDLDLIKKAEEELAAVAALSMPLPPPLPTIPMPVLPPELPPAPLPPPTLENPEEGHGFGSFVSPIKTNIPLPPQPKPPGLEDEDFPNAFAQMPATNPSSTSSATSPNTSKGTASQKFIPKSGVVMCVKRKINEDGSSSSPTKTSRTKSRWGQGPSNQ